MSTKVMSVGRIDRVRVGRNIRSAIACLYAAGSVVHVLFGTFRPSVYRSFAGESSLGFVRDGWHDVFMAQPRAWALVLAAGEAVIATLLLQWPAAGYVAVVLFTAALVLFGWGFLLWSAPFLALVVLAIVLERSGHDEHEPAV